VYHSTLGLRVIKKKKGWVDRPRRGNFFAVGAPHDPTHHHPLLAHKKQHQPKTLQCLGPYGSPRGVECFLWARYPCRGFPTGGDRFWQGVWGRWDCRPRRGTCGRSPTWSLAPLVDNHQDSAVGKSVWTYMSIRMDIYGHMYPYGWS